MKRYQLFGLFCAFCASLILFSCKKEKEIQIPVTSIALDRTDVVLDKGQTGSLTATIEPADATDNTVSWTSSATDVVTVSADGTSATIKAVKGGTATISVTCGGKSASCEVAVVPEGAVDLGVVMTRGDGTKYHLFWAKTNLSEDGFCAKPEDTGDYFAWGETEPYYEKGHTLDDPCSHWRRSEKGYDWASYTHLNQTTGMLTRYCVTDRVADYWGEGEPDNKTDFSDYDYVDDAARTILGANGARLSLKNGGSCSNNAPGHGRTTTRGLACPEVSSRARRKDTRTRAFSFLPSGTGAISFSPNTGNAVPICHHTESRTIRLNTMSSTSKRKLHSGGSVTSVSRVFRSARSGNNQ